MPTPKKRALSTATPATPAEAKPQRPKPTAKPFLRFYHSDALRKKTLALLTSLENAEDATEHRDALAALVVELTSSGMDYYFLHPLKLAKAGFMVEQSASLGLAGVQQVMASVVRKIIGRMDSPQLLSVCGSIRSLMV